MNGDLVLLFTGLQDLYEVTQDEKDAPYTGIKPSVKEVRRVV